MKVLIINGVCGIGSTGRICAETANDYEEKGYEVKIAYGRGTVPDAYKKYAVRIGNEFDVLSGVAHTRFTDGHGFFNNYSTKKFLKWADGFNPDILWLHNIHGYYINVELLFDWIKKRPEMQVKWTLHDCWAFTGHCAHFTAAHCNQWKTQCIECTQMNQYPASYTDNCKSNFERKKNAFCGVKNMELISPSNWLAGLVKESFLKEYPIRVVHNKINTDWFKPTYGGFRKKYNLQDKKIVLGVSAIWNERKGLNDFFALSDMLDDTYKIVLVGLDNHQLKNLPEKIIGIAKTDSPVELAEIYTAADVFVNPTREETFGLVNIEALACGTPVVTFNAGGSPECIDASCGSVVDIDDLSEMKNEIVRICSDKPYSEQSCLKRAALFDKKVLVN